MKIRHDTVENEAHLVKRIRIYSATCASFSAFAACFLFFTNFLVSYPIWTLRALVLLFCGLNFGSKWSGLFRNAAAETLNWANYRYSSKTGYRNIRRYWKFLLILLGSVVAFHTAQVLLGAPLFKSVSGTLHFAVFLTAVISLPGVLLFGCDEQKWLDIILGNGPNTKWEESWLRLAIGTVIGAWLGAFVIPLDWDRPWQVWPICGTYGVLVTFTIAHVYNLVVLRPRHGKRRKAF